MGGGGDERATAPAPPRPAYPRRRSARVRATAAAAPTSPRRGHGGRRRAGRLPQRFPVGVRFPRGGGRLGKRFRFKLGARVSAPDCGTSRLASGQRAWALGPARRGAAREDADGTTPPAAPALAAAPAPPRRRPFPLPWKQIGGRGEGRGGAAPRGCGIAPGGRASLRR
ncbi:translation initiation factor IF-2-like [Trachypithecus francoisi]|uniref:translation initiation factor IF-2-like n=1 Tax=Trachypithecus francoisi TaxID=54180 RepID=UPI00141AFB29|nr:translation initiation factor IF-2-like [Trachypithecus francoisi]XP_033084846.1 translation initiation factor IF-2-like [Trachypithecus francoisi]XP_033085321.1 translation initiation factor IF-2-like [Trachypithecus francoisi]XP_033086200.1 translation initiation factor IF-2-like [Trachypithecus francoisi]XP_033087051.1 translation initiation factor IF-2-like [Trachypithecus francoisi]XP_033087858.1 translation initiation factor IF-2-like [Trachypithecus francoisi]